MLHSAGTGAINELAKWEVIPTDYAYEWLIKNDHADVVPDDDLDKIEI